MKLPLKLENSMEEKIAADPEWLEGAFWGEPRRGHPEGKIIHHIEEIFKNIDKLKVSKKIREKLRLIALVHDTFKYKVDENKERSGENHHAYFARKFAEKYIDDQEILEIIELHDEAYNSYQKGKRGDKWDIAEERATKLICRLKDSIKLYLLFYKCDNETGDKRQENLQWFEQLCTRLQSYRAIAVKGKKEFTQKEIFSLIKKLKKEKILTFKELLDAIPNESYKQISTKAYGWRAREYVVYRKGFEQKLDLELGEKIVYIENKLDYTFEIPDVKVWLATKTGGFLTDLRKTAGMAVFDIHKLQYDPKKRVVKVIKDFNPQRDVKIIDIMRPHGWALYELNGFPTRLLKSDDKNPKAIYSWTKEAKDFEDGSTGYHGSIYRKLDFDDWREMDATHDWRYLSGVAVEKE